MKKITVSAAIIINNNKILCVQRGNHKLSYIANKYEFPGGKIEKGETKEEAVIREIKEELDMNVQANELLLTVKHQYPDFHITMHCFLCDCISNELTLNEHIAFKWLAISELDTLDWAEADIPVVNKLIRNGK